MPLTPQAYAQVKTEEHEKLKAIEHKHDAEIATLKEEIRFMRQLIKNTDIVLLEEAMLDMQGSACIEKTPWWHADKSTGFVGYVEMHV
jgi:hypothetical protein